MMGHDDVIVASIGSIYIGGNSQLTKCGTQAVVVVTNWRRSTVVLIHLHAE